MDAGLSSLGPSAPRPLGPSACPVTSTAPIATPLPVTTFTQRLAERLDAHAAARDADFDAFVARHGLARTDALRREHARARLLFEATRDGGFWRTRWRITNQDASARLVWAAWRARPPRADEASAVVCECDEVSALFASLAHAVGVRKVGLFWPTWNHTIAAWEPEGTSARVLVPTTQIFQGCDATFDQTDFDPRVQRTVFEFPATDLGKEPVPTPLAEFLLGQLDAYGDASSDTLAAIRLHRAIGMVSSVGARCRASIARFVALRSGTELPCGDRRALDAYALERGRAVHDDADRLSILAD